MIEHAEGGLTLEWRPNGLEKAVVRQTELQVYLHRGARTEFVHPVARRKMRLAKRHVRLHIVPDGQRHCAFLLSRSTSNVWKEHLLSVYTIVLSSVKLLYASTSFWTFEGLKIKR